MNFPNGYSPFHPGAVIAIAHPGGGRKGYLMLVDDVRLTTVGIEVDGRPLGRDLTPDTSSRREHLTAGSYTVLDRGRPPAARTAEPRPAGWVDADVLAALATDQESAWWVLGQEYAHGRIREYFAAARAHGALYVIPIVLSHSPDPRHAHHMARINEPFYERCWVVGPAGLYPVDACAGAGTRDERLTVQLPTVPAVPAVPAAA
jgi:hypothetical protein